MTFDSKKNQYGTKLANGVSIFVNACRYSTPEALAKRGTSIPTLSQGQTGAIAVSSGDPLFFQTSNPYLRVDDELIKVTVDSATQLTIIERGAFGTDDVAHTTNVGFPYNNVRFPYTNLGFPITNQRSSGILLPSYGNSVALGYNLKNLGYYFGINDYIDLKLTSDIFTRGSFRIGINSNYKKRYKYQGGINLNFSKTKIGEEYRNDYSINNDFSIKWNHQEDPPHRALYP